MHGYDLRKRLREEFGPLSNLSYGSLYPALARLESDGAIRAFDTQAPVRREPMPFTGSLGGERAATVARRATQAAALALSARGTRGRKVYEITPRGEALFDELLESDTVVEDARSFTLHLAFARHLSGPARVRLLERRRAHVAARLERAQRARRQPTRALDEYEQAIAERAEAVIESELAWIDGLLARELHVRNADATPRAAASRGADRGDTDRGAPSRRPRPVTTSPAPSGAASHSGRGH